MEKRNDTPNGAQIEDISASSPSNRNGAHLPDDFIMHPTNDVCFAGLMENPAVRKGFCSAILRIKPEEIEETTLLPTHLRREYADDKLGILDMRVCLKSGPQINMEMQVKKFDFWNERTLFYLSKMFAEQLRKGESYEKLKKCVQVSILDFILYPEDKRSYRTVHFRDDEDGRIYNDKMELQILELKKLPEELRTGEHQTGEDIVKWMRFFNGKSRKEFEDMAQADIYMGEAYEALKRLSADEKKRLEYEAREKALRDYNCQINCAEKRGREEGRTEGRREGLRLAASVFGLHGQGISDTEIARQCKLSEEEVREILNMQMR